MYFGFTAGMAHIATRLFFIKQSADFPFFGREGNLAILIVRVLPASLREK